MMQWERDELEEKIGQFARLVMLVYEEPDNSMLWDKLIALAKDHKSYIADSYLPPDEIKEPMGYDVSLLDGIDEYLNF